jgi:hypothetical protein
MKLFVLVVPPLFVLAACDSQSAPAASPTPPSAATRAPTPVALIPDAPFEIQGPLASDTAGPSFDALPSGAEIVVIAVDLQTLWIIRPVILDAASRRYASLMTDWLDEGTLAIQSEGRTYEWRPGDGSLRTRGPLSTATSPPDASASSDGIWRVDEQQTGQYIDLLVGRVDEPASFRLTNTAGARWSPAGPSRAAMLGNPCIPPGLFDVLLFDTETASLRTLTADLPEDVGMFLANFRWHPDGKRIAIETWGRTGARSRLLIVNVDTGEMQSVPLARNAGPVPMSWSPGGGYITVHFEGAHGGLFCEQRTDWQPSTVELLAP